MTTLAIYLAGTIQKAHEKHSDESFWTDDHMSVIRAHIGSRSVTFLNPASRSDDLSDQQSVFGRDMLQVFCADAVFVDARQRRGLGVGAEMMWAKVNSIPVIIWAPEESHYNKSLTTVLNVSVENWIHPFVESLSDAIVSTVEEGALWLQSCFDKNPGSRKVKDREHIFSCMKYYSDTYFTHDEPMKECMRSSSHLLERMNSFKR